MRPPLLVTPGDPAGVGPEIAVAALAQTGLDAVLIGSVEALRRWAPGLAVVEDLRPNHPARGGLRALALPPSEEPVEVQALRVAAAACQRGEGRALVTGPIHKARLRARGFAYTGHTDFLGALCGVEEPLMAFVGGPVRVILVTVHVPLAAVPALITPARVLHTLRHAHAALRAQLGVPAPRLVVCGLNPHAGEQGELGREEIDAIAPAVAQARAEGIDARGPVSAETAFMHPEEGDMIVAMYHDQGLAPLKRVDFGRLVNWTIGLPIVRTSVDHGTADALVGTGLARPDSMIAALQLADALTSRA